MSKYEAWAFIFAVTAIPIGLIIESGYSKRLETDLKLACYEAAKTNHTITCENKNVPPSK